MAAIGRAVLSGVTGVAEVTNALAAINFDFTMVRLEAPHEYHGLGQSLSKKRKRNAEESSAHVTARKLGALFAGVVPDIPNLERAYGLRVSEIAEDRKHNPRGKSSSDGVLAEYVGADGTSIWAAATSGKAALAVHLLACMLARAWNGPEATSIWSEFVEARKKVLLEATQNSEFSLDTLTAAQIVVSREDLASWDASARSWLRTADAVKKLQQTQLMLVIGSISMSLDSAGDVYSKVLKIWQRALETAERLISGTPQSVTRADILLGLSAWHLYPDMSILSTEVKEVNQKDPLVKNGGILTIGLHRKDDQDQSGVTWSLSLGHLAYSRQPVLSVSSINEKTSRVTFDQFTFVAFGGAISEWKLGRSNNAIQLVSKFFITLSDAIVSAAEKLFVLHESEFYSKTAWIKVFAICSKRYLEASDRHQDEFRRLIWLGQRQFRRLFGSSEAHPYIGLGLNSKTELLKILNLKSRVGLLREHGSTFLPGVPLQNAVIRYRLEDISEYDNTSGHGNISRHDETTFVYASIVPEVAPGRVTPQYHQWFFDSYFPKDKATLKANYQHHAQLLISHMEDTIAAGETWSHVTVEYDIPISRGDLKWSTGSWTASIMSPELFSATQHCGLQRPGSPGMNTPYDLISQVYNFISGPTDINYELIFGDSNFGVWLPQEVHPRAQTELKLEEIVTFLSDCSINFTNFLKYFDGHFRGNGYFQSLEAFSEAYTIHEQLQSFEVDLQINNIQLCDARWFIHEGEGLERVFACIAMFGTGKLNLEPGDLSEVLAICFENTIYASEILFNDPCQMYQSKNMVRALVGNVERPGVALLLASRDATCRERKMDEWKLVNHREFDGKLEDNFKGLSMHLSLTGYEIPIKNYARWRDKDLFYLEVRVSAYERGEWLADLNLDFRVIETSNALTLAANYLLKLPERCQHATSEIVWWPHDLISIDNWYEFADHPAEDAIIRTSGNWMARLTFAAICSQERRYAIILQPNDKPPCQDCLNKTIERIVSAQQLDSARSCDLIA